MGATRPTSHTARRALPGLLAVAVVAIVLGIVLGIVGMHALSIHGSMSGSAAMSGSMSGSDHAAMADDGLGAATDVTGVTGETGVADSGHGHGMGDMVMLCAAMLAAAGAIVLLTLRLRPTRHVWADLLAAPVAVVRQVTARLGTGPPPVWEFSVIRC